MQDSVSGRNETLQASRPRGELKQADWFFTGSGSHAAGYHTRGVIFANVGKKLRSLPPTRKERP